MLKTCKNCLEEFELLPEDFHYFEVFKVEPPSHCPACRMQRRLAFRNERTLHHRKCDLTGKQIISAYSADKPFQVYDIDAWWSDDWDPLSYGREFNFRRPFFEQFHELRMQVPRLALIQQKPMENSAYTNCVGREKNCYMVFSSNSSEDCYYGSWVNSCKDCVDSLSVESCELCYECNGCRNCYKLLFSRDCIDCSDSYFLRDCTSCKNCLGCNSLVGKEYCLFNKEVGKEKYLEFLNSIDFGSYEQVEKLKTQIESALGVVTVKELHGAQNENSSGDYLRNCRDTYYSFEVNNAEELRYCVCLQDARTSMDHSYWGKNSELIYECQACGFDVYHLRFCNLCWSGCSNLTYCEHCFSSQDCLGSIGLKKQKYCIFNKKYSKKEYLELSQEIIAHMKKTGEWGEYFPVEHSTYSYNESLAHEQFPMSKSEVLKKGWNWLSSEDDKELKYIGGDTELPDNIKDAGKDVVGKIFKCLDSGKLYKITLPEFEFYQRMNIPLPRLSADARHLKRLTARNPRMLWDRQCASCDKGIKTSYAPARPERVFCEDCYHSEIFS